MFWLKKQKIYIIGIVHSAQNNVLLQNQLNLLRKRNFDDAFLDREKVNALGVRKHLIHEIETYKPDAIFEESGAWEKEPGDVLKYIIKNEKTIPETFSSIPHFFVDAKKIEKEKPSIEKRESEMVSMIKEIMRVEKFQKPIFIIGAFHLKSIDKKLKRAGFSTNIKNLKILFPFGK